MKIITEENVEKVTTFVDDTTTIADMIVKTITKTPLAWAVLTQYSPITFKGFMGFKTDWVLQKATVQEGIGSGPVPLDTNSGPITITTAPFINPTTGSFVGASQTVAWTLTGANGTSITGVTQTRQDSTALVTIGQGTLAYGTYSILLDATGTDFLAQQTISVIVEE